MTSRRPIESGYFTAFSSASDESGGLLAGRDPGKLMERTELERRVLAHERILQALISHIALGQPEILAKLKSTFGSGHNLGEYEQDFTSTEHYGANFIRSIEALVARQQSTAPIPAHRDRGERDPS